MSNVSAYLDLPKGEFAPITGDHHWAEGELETQGPDGLEVTWMDAYPEGAQVYIEWSPRVFAVWDKEDEQHGTEVEPAGSQGLEEPDSGVGTGGGEPGEAP